MTKLTKRNPIVLRVEHGHPGYADHQILATKESLRGFFDDAMRQLELAGKRNGKLVSVEWTLAHEKSSHVYVSFHLASSDDIESYHTRPLKARILPAFKVIGRLVALLLALFGLIRLIGG